MKRFFSISISVLLLLLAAPPHVAAQTGERTLQGSIDGAPYTIKLPATWNGTLLVYEAGYRDVADAPGEVANRTADPFLPQLVPQLLSRGYALAGSAFRANGYNIEEGIEDTQALLKFFRKEIGRPERTILFGVSGGAVRAAEILETNDSQVDAAITVCGVMAGTPLFFDRALDVAVAYASAFGWPAAWGTPGDLKDDLDFRAGCPASVPASTHEPRELRPIRVHPAGQRHTAQWFLQRSFDVVYKHVFHDRSAGATGIQARRSSGTECRSYLPPVECRPGSSGFPRRRCCRTAAGHERPQVSGGQNGAESGNM
jgi:hypothetical protein